MRSVRLAIATMFLLTLFHVKQAAAQTVVDEASLLNAPPREYNPIGLRLGKAMLFPDLYASVGYDSNIYAEPTHAKSDRILQVSPNLRATIDEGRWRLRGLVEADVRMFQKHPSENSTAALADFDLRFTPTETQSYRGNISWRHVAEDRGDPEARNAHVSGPRRFDDFHGEIAHSREAGGWLVNGVIAADRYKYASIDDRFRDHLALAAQVTAGRRIGGFTYGTLIGFVNRRTFDLKTDLSGFQRDATTYGARAGIQINPGRILQGEASVGVFRFDPKDPKIRAYTGISAAANLAYRPTERTAILFDGLRGNVATFRVGAQSRTDTRLHLSVQQEVRHNIYATGSLYYRQSEFRGSNISERTRGAEMAVEYLLDRHIGIAARARYSRRTSDDPFAEFERFRGGLELRLHY